MASESPDLTLAIDDGAPTCRVVSVRLPVALHAELLDIARDLNLPLSRALRVMLAVFCTEIPAETLAGMRAAIHGEKP